ncbi:hypothetical protein GCM10019059_22590 [Camelimonas fluminis]|nr:hypothetical protein GCM10019059_22590 [Camelimonas fluminis]
MQDDLRILRIVFVPSIVQRLSRAGERDRGYQPQLVTIRKKPVSKRAMVVAGRLEANDDGRAIAESSADRRS